MDEQTRILLQGAREGSPTARSALFDLHRERLAAGLRRRFDIDHHDLEDLIQETLARAFRNLDRFEYRGQGSFLAWLFSTATFEWKRTLRYRRADRRDAARRTPLPEESARAPADDDPSPSKLAAGREFELRLYELMEGLPEAERRAIELRRLLQLSFEEIREELGLPSEGAARALLSRAEVRLADLLGRDGP